MRAEPGPEDVWAEAALAQPAGTADTSWELQPEEQVEGRRWSKGSQFWAQAESSSCCGGGGCPVFLGFSGGSVDKESAHSAGDLGWEDPLRGERLPTSVFWAGECHGLHSPRDSQELDTTD